MNILILTILITLAIQGLVLSRIDRLIELNSRSSIVRKVSIGLNILAFLVAAATFIWTYNIDTQLRSLESANVGVRQNDISLASLPGISCIITSNACDRIDIALRNTGNATANNVALKAYICLFNDEIKFANGFSCLERFNTSLISTLPAGEIANFAVIDISHELIDGNIHGEQLAIFVFVSFFDTLTESDIPTRFHSFQYPVGQTFSADGSSSLGHLTMDDYQPRCTRLQEDLLKVGAPHAFIGKLPSC